MCAGQHDLQSQSAAFVRPLERRAKSPSRRCFFAGQPPRLHFASTSDGRPVEADAVPLGTTIPGSRRSGEEGEGGEGAGREGKGAAWRSSSIAMIQLGDLLDHFGIQQARFCSTLLRDALTSTLARPTPSPSPLILTLHFISSPARSIERWMLYQPRLPRLLAERHQHEPEQQQERMGRRTSGARFSTASRALGALPPRIASY